MRETGQNDRKRSGRPARRRPTGKERRQQIIDVTLDLVAEYGVTGATLTRIASTVGVTPPALYAHFANRREILLAALGVLIERRTALHRDVTEGTALERLREIGHRHSELVASESDRSVLALFEFIAAPRQEGLREAVGDKHLLLVESLSELVREGQREGAIVEAVDPEQIAWMIVSRAWTEDIAQLMGLSHRWNEERSNTMLELILDSIAVKD
ncbi:MAG: TetR/AcrR family transcriptional regulator [Thermoleophilia bacterium]|nr:TetR/AcrR family transcriptional regulator [Thermoleophilia bacterium]